MPKDGRLSVSEIIHKVLGNRIIKDDTHCCKMCKDDYIYKNVLSEHYQLTGFKLLGLDGQCYGSDYNYYQKYSFDIKDLQKQLGELLRKEGYAVDYVILQPKNNKNNWVINLTVNTVFDHLLEHKHKNHAKCLKHSK